MPATDFARTVAQIANSQVGVQEQPLGSNSGPKVNQYLKAVNCPPGKPWCAAFLGWCVLKASIETGHQPQLRFSASALHLWELNPDLQTRDLDVEDLPLLGVFDHGGGKGHVAVVLGYNPDSHRLQTIEGNGSLNGSREGLAVVALDRRHITDAQLVGFLRIQ